MNKIFLSLSYLLILSSFSYSYALELTQTGGGGNLGKCISGVDIQVKNYNFGNFYHGGIPEISIQKGLHSYFVKKCGIYASWNIVNNNLTGMFVPIYEPIRGVTGFYMVYSDNSATGSHFYLSNTLHFDSDKGEKFIAGFYGGIIPYRNIPIRMNNEAYLRTFSPPFSSAYMIQLYSYLGRPMLVARDNSGQVIDVFFQNRPYISNPMEVARKYLGDKWYHP